MRATGSYLQLMDINKDLANTVSIGTEDDPANLKVWGSLLATSTAYANDILPGTRGVQNIGSNDEAGNGLLEWGDLYLAEGGVISIGGSAAINNDLDVTLTQVAPAANDRGLLLNGASKVYFDDGTDYNQYIGSSGSNTTLISSPLMDIAASSALNLASSGSVAFTSATTTAINSGGDLTLTTPVASKLIFNTNTAGTISHTSDLATEDFTIEQLGAVDASLILSSAGTGTDGIKLEASAGGIDINAADAQDVAIAGGQITLASEENVASAISLTTNVGTSETIVVTNTRGTAPGAIKLDAQDGGIDIDATPVVGLGANPSLTVTNTAAADAQDFTIEQAGAFDASLLLSSTGTGTDAIGLNASAGDISIMHAAGKKVLFNTDIAGTISHTSNANGEDFTIEQIGAVDASLALSSAGTGVDAIVISAGASDATKGGIDIDAYPASGLSAPTLVITNNSAAADQDLKIEQKGPVDASLLLSSAGTGVDAIELNASAGDISIMHAAGKKVIFNKDIEGIISHTSNADAEDFEIEQLGAFDASLILYSAGTGDDAIDIEAEFGGVTVDAAATKDVLVIGGQVALVSKDNTASAISLTANQGASETIVLTNTQGTDPAAINFEASAGGVLVSADGNIADAIKLHATAGAAQTIALLNTAGTSSGAIAFTSVAGGINIDAATGKDVSITGGKIALTPEDNAASAITLTTNTGPAETIVITNTLGTVPAAINLEASAGGVLVSADGSLADAIKLDATAGGIDIFASGAAPDEDIDIVATGSSVNIQSTESDAAAIVIKSTVGGIDILAEAATGDTDNENIDITATGSSVIITSTEDVEDAIGLYTTHGGIEIWAEGAGVAASDDIDIVAIGSSVNIQSTENTTAAIYLHTNGGASESIVFHADQGTGAGSIELTSDAGGIDINAPAGVFNVQATNFSVSDAGLVSSTLGFAGPMTSSQMTSSDPIVISSSNDAPNSVQITSTVGGIDISASGAGPTEDIDIVATGSSVNISSSEGGGALDAITINATAGGIDINSALAFDVASSASVAFSSATTTDIDATGSLSLNSSAGQINIGHDNNSQNINIGTGAAARTITMGNNTGVTGIVLTSGTGDITATSTDAVTVTAAGTLTMQGAGVSKYGDDIATLNFDGTGVVTETDMTSMAVSYTHLTLPTNREV